MDFFQFGSHLLRPLIKQAKQFLQKIQWTKFGLYEGLSAFPQIHVLTSSMCYEYQSIRGMCSFQVFIKTRPGDLICITAVTIRMHGTGLRHVLTAPYNTSKTSSQHMGWMHGTGSRQLPSLLTTQTNLRYIHG